MAIHPIAVTFKGTKYVGEYEVAEDLGRVLFENRIKTGVLRGHDAELLARIFLIESRGCVFNCEARKAVT